MAKLTIGEWEVDFKRCQISRHAELISVEPKVIEVLACLAEHRNQVVSQTDIFSKVWPDSIFNPSSVQRCIAILRKIVEVDTKNPQYIITHAKRGYRLVLEEPQARNVAKAVGARWWLLLVILSLLGILTMLSSFSGLNSEVKTKFTRLYPVTSSEESEHTMSLSPNGEIVAFVKIGHNKKNQIWLKRLANGQEIQLSASPSNYQSLGWARDGTAIAFINRQDGKDQLAYQTVDTMTLNALPVVELAEFEQNSVVSYQLQWSSQGEIFFVQEGENETRLLRRFSTRSGQTTTLASYPAQQRLLTVALSPDEQTLALGFDLHQNTFQLSLFSLATQQSEDIALLDDSILGLSWHPNGESLLLSNRNKLQTVDLSGRISKIDFDNFQYVRNAQFSPDGQAIFMELFSLDVDIAYSDRSNPALRHKIVNTRSVDWLPIYAPGADKFVFMSRRNGPKQLFIYEAGFQRLVFDNPLDEELFGIVWSGDGNTIMTAAKDKLYIIDADKGSYNTLASHNGPFSLWEWYADEPALLVSRVTNEGLKPAKYALDSQQLTPLVSPQSSFNCSYMTLDEQDNLLISDDNSIFMVLPDGQMSMVWQTMRGKIKGFTPRETGLTVMLDFAEHYELIDVALDDNTETPILSAHYADNFILTNSAKNADKFLFVEPKDSKTLVKLQ